MSIHKHDIFHGNSQMFLEIYNYDAHVHEHLLSKQIAGTVSYNVNFFATNYTYTINSRDSLCFLQLKISIWQTTTAFNYPTVVSKIDIWKNKPKVQCCWKISDVTTYSDSTIINIP